MAVSPKTPLLPRRCSQAFSFLSSRVSSKAPATGFRPQPKPLSRKR